MAYLRSVMEMEPETAYALQQAEEWEHMEAELIEDFPQFQDEICQHILQEVCLDEDGELEHGGEGTCCLVKRRRIKEEATHLAEAWESSEILKKMFRREAVPSVFKLAIRFLD